jgi:hypothetical protein
MSQQTPTDNHPIYHPVPGPPRVRPVTIDAEGRIFLETGEQVVIPGLEPEKVLEGLADDAAGRGRPLREIMAERRRAESPA